MAWAKVCGLAAAVAQGRRIVGITTSWGPLCGVGVMGNGTGCVPKLCHFFWPGRTADDGEPGGKVRLRVAAVPESPLHGDLDGILGAPLSAWVIAPTSEKSELGGVVLDFGDQGGQPSELTPRNEG